MKRSEALDSLKKYIDFADRWFKHDEHLYANQILTFIETLNLTEPNTLEKHWEPEESSLQADKNKVD